MKQTRLSKNIVDLQKIEYLQNIIAFWLVSLEGDKNTPTVVGVGTTLEEVSELCVLTHTFWKVEEANEIRDMLMLETKTWILKTMTFWKYHKDGL